jgi:hypothetical protein
MLRSRMPRLAAVMSIAVVSLAMSAGSASAQPQTGLVNVDISGNTVQVPISIAANLCDTTVAVRVADLREDGRTRCDADATADAVSTGDGGGGGGPQTGLVNVRISDNTVQIPIAAAANVCDTTIAILAVDVAAGGATCDAVANSRARN